MTWSKHGRTLAVVGSCGRRVVLGFGLDSTGRCSGDRDTRPKVVADEEVFEEEGEEVAIEEQFVVDTRRLPVKLFNVRRISSLLELAWSNAMVAPACFESSKKSIPRKVRTNDAVMFGVSIVGVGRVQQMFQWTKYVVCVVWYFVVRFRAKLWRDGPSVRVWIFVIVLLKITCHVGKYQNDVNTYLKNSHKMWTESNNH